MGVFTETLESTVYIAGSKHEAGFQALRRGLPKELASVRNLADALSALRYEYEHTPTGDLCELRFEGGKNDSSHVVLGLLAPYIEPGGHVVLDHDGERERLSFDGKGMSVQEDEGDEETDDEVWEFFNRIENDSAAIEHFERIFERFGHSMS